MSGLQDARVLSAFTQGVQRAYMLGVEQRLTDAGAQLAQAAGSTAGPVRLNHASVTKTSNFSTSSSTAVDVTGLSLDITTSGGDLLLLATAQDCYVHVNSGGATGEIAFGVDGTDTWVWLQATTDTEADTYGLCAATLVSLAAGSHTIKLRAKTNAGELRLNSGATYPAILMAVEL